MTIAYIILIVAGCLLTAMAIESLLKNVSFINAAISLLLFSAALVIGCEGLLELCLLSNYQSLTSMILRVGNSAWILAGIAFLLLSVYFPRDKALKPLTPSYYPIFIVLGLFFLFILIGFDLERVRYVIVYSPGSVTKKIITLDVRYNLLHYIILLMNFGIILYSWLKILLKYRKTYLVYQRKQIRYFFTGVFFFIAMLLILKSLGSLLPQLLNYVIYSLIYLITGAIVLYSVISYRFNNIRKNIVSLGKDLLIGAVLSVFITSLLYMISPWLSKMPALFYYSIMIPTFILLLWLYNGSMALIKKMLKMDIQTKDITELYLDRMGASLNIHELAEQSIHVIMENIHCGFADFLQFDRDKETYKPVYSSNNKEYQISALDPFFRYITEEVDFFDRERINFDPAYLKIRDLGENFFDKYRAAFLIPIFYEKNLMILIKISNKVDNTAFSTTDMELLLKLKKVILIVLNNIILFEKEQDSKLTKRDLSLASHIQESVFQKTIPLFDSMEVYGYQKPAKGVSGDYFLIEKIDQNTMGVLIADVSGKGFSAALIAMMIHTIAKSQEFSSTTTSAIVSKINEVMTSNQDKQITKTMSFATLFCGYIDNKNKTLFYTNAGHYPMLVLNVETGVYDSIKANSRPVGIFPDAIFISETYSIQSGSILVLYSDGITETINSQEEEFGLERMQELIIQNQGKPARDISDVIISAVDEFSEGLEQFDDITLIVIKL